MVSIHRPGSSSPATQRLPTAEAPGTGPRPVNDVAPDRPLSQARSTFEAAPVRPQQAQVDDPSDDTVVLMDDFVPDGTEPPHGELVGYVVTANSSIPASQVRKVQNVHVGGLRPDLDGRIEDIAKGFLRATTDNLKAINANPGNVKVINQSQGLSKFDLTSLLWQEKLPAAPATKAEQEQAVMDLAVELGMAPAAVTDLWKKDPEVRARAVFQALADKVDSVLDGSQPFKDAKAAHREAVDQLGQKGIFVVVAAGNEGEVLKRMKKGGMKFDADFTDSSLFHHGSPNLIVVGASRNDREMAKLSTPSNYVTLATDGTKIRTGPDRKDEGTSVAAPQVSVLIAEMRNKGYSPEQVRSFLLGAARRGPASSTSRRPGSASSSCPRSPWSHGSRRRCR